MKNRIAVLPCYCVFVDNFIKYSCVGCVACNIRNSRGPAFEYVSVLSRSCLGRSCTCVCRFLAVGNLAALKNRIAVLPCYCVFVDNFIKYSCVGCVACDIRNSRGPAFEYVSVLSRSCLGRSCTCVCRFLAVGNLAALKNRIAVLPCYCVFVDNFIKYSCVGCVACDIRNSRGPAFEYVSVLSRSCLGRSCTCVCRFLAVGNLAALKNRIAVLPCYCVFVDNFIKYSCVGCVACDIRNSRGPAFEYVSVLSRSCLCRSIARVGRSFAVSNLAALKNSVAVLPGYCVLIGNCVKQCIVGRIACDLGNIGRPALKYVCILIRCFLLRCCSVKLRGFSIGYFICLKNFIVAFPNDCVFIKNCVKYGVVGRIACNSRNLGRPAFEYISVLSCCGFLRDIARISRHFAVANLINFKNRISVFPGYLINVCCCIELCRVCYVACNGNDFGRPALEAVCVLSRSCLCRSCACVCRLCAVGNLCALKNSIAVLPCYGIFSEN